VLRYNKLIRDKIPDIIRGNGSEPVLQILDDEAYKLALGKKLQEEVAEFGEAGAVEELVDILEVIYALAAVQRVNPSQLEALRLEKAQERGGFERRLFLIEVKPAKDIL
jgi:predicted house-cleaning noncanonical NTP pyrophosphatase (MazG superfamily)